MNRIVSSSTVKIESTEIKPVCAVLLSAYNGEKYIGEQIRSILNQEKIECRIIIRDDGSHDNTVKEILALQRQFPSQITIIKGKNVGIHESFRELMLQAPDCDYIAFSDQDDKWDVDKIIIAITTMRINDSDMYSCASRLVDEDGNDLGKTTSNEQKYRYYMCGNNKVLSPGAQGCTIVVTKQFLSQIVEKKIPNNYGHDTWIPIVAYYLGRSVYDVNPHMSYRQHNESWTGNRKKKVKQYYVETKYFLRGLRRYKQLAKDVLDRYSDNITDEDKDILRCIASENMNAARRLRAIHKYRFGKYGWKENLIFKLYYVFFY